MIGIVILVCDFALDDGQYVREIELILGKEVVEFAFEFEFADEARVDFYEGEFGLFGREEPFEGAELGKAGHG